MQKKSALNRREILCYGFIICLLLQLFTFIGISVAYAMPREMVLKVGSVYDFPPGHEPVVMPVNGEYFGFWLVNTGDEIFAFYPESPDTTHCWFMWSTTTERFEDPCSGSKFAADGSYLEGPAIRRQLDRYLVTLDDGEIWVNLSRLTKAEAMANNKPLHHICAYKYHYETRRGREATTPTSTWHLFDELAPDTPQRYLVKEPVFCRYTK